MLACPIALPELSPSWCTSIHFHHATNQGVLLLLPGMCHNYTQQWCHVWLCEWVCCCGNRTHLFAPVAPGGTSRTRGTHQHCRRCLGLRLQGMSKTLNSHHHPRTCMHAPANVSPWQRRHDVDRAMHGKENRHPCIQLVGASSSRTIGQFHQGGHVIEHI